MATVQKTTMKRYNGTDWDPVYLANSADIVYIGTGFTVAQDLTGYAIGDTVAATDATFDVVKKVVNQLATVDKVTIPTLKSGEAIVALAASKLTGTVARANLPSDVGGKGVEVATEAAKAALTKADVNIGDIVKVTGGKVYLVTGYTGETVNYMELTDSASEIAWSRITGTPTTLAGYGITDAVNSSEKVTSASALNAGKILVLNSAGKLDVSITGDAATLESHAAAYFATKSEHDTLAGRVTTNEGDITQLKTDVKNIDATWIKTGTIDIARLPAAAIPKLYICADETARAALTKDDVQNGDSVKVMSTGLMYFVVDDTKLGTSSWEQAYVEYTAGRASAVDWSGVENKPTTIAGYGITDAVNVSDVVTVATANKILKLNADAKLPASITGDAATLGTHDASYFATKSEHDTLAGRVTTAEGDIDTLEGKVSTLETDMGTAKTDITNLKSGEAITALAASKITGTMTRAQLPADISGRLVKVADTAAMYALTAEQVAVGDLVKLNSGDVYVVVNVSKLSEAAGYEQIIYGGGSMQVDWSNIQNKPTTIAGYGITDAVNSSEKVTTASAANAGKILVLNSAGKLDVDITGHVDWANINDKPTSTVAQIDAAVTAATHTNRAVLDLLGVETEGDVKHLLYNSQAIAYKSELDTVALGSLKVVSSLPSSATTGQLILENIS